MESNHLSGYIADLAAELNVSFACATDVEYLRTRNRHTPELEQELIELHRKGTPPNIFSFGCTEETGKKLLNLAESLNNMNRVIRGE